MKFLIPLCFLALVDGYTDTKKRSFLPKIMFGAGSSAYQVEGAWSIDGKGESIWDRFLHENPELVADGRNGDEAGDSYHQYKRDVQMLRELGVDHYRFSISWPRVLPTGFSNNINEKGLQYYDNLIAELLKYNIEPMVTLYHFDLPQRLQDLGGWANPYSVNWFEDYAAVLFKRYADKVKYWVTINQPNSICVDGYGDNTMAPGIDLKGIADYMCIKNVMLAHAKAYRLYQNKYKKKYSGSVGIAISVNWADPINNKTENAKAAEIYRDFTIGLYMHPIWSKEGGFPKTVKDIVAKRSQEQGFTKSRLPALSPEEKTLLKGSADFLGMNHYTTFLVSPSKTEHPSPSFADDVRADLSYGKQWKPSQSAWLKSVPYGIYKAFLHINIEYDYPTVFITEHGWSTAAALWDQSRVDNLNSVPYGIYKAFLHINKEYDYPTVFITEHGWSTAAALWDQSRVDNFNEYMTALLFALEDGAELLGYTAWSLADNVEWTAGTSERFGLYQVDFESPDKTRTARLSALQYRRLIETRAVDKDWRPTSLAIDVSDRRLKMKNKKTEL